MVVIELYNFNFKPLFSQFKTIKLI